jgi:hypothetical protein
MFPYRRFHINPNLQIGRFLIMHLYLPLNNISAASRILKEPVNDRCGCLFAFATVECAPTASDGENAVGTGISQLQVATCTMMRTHSVSRFRPD